MLQLILAIISSNACVALITWLIGRSKAKAEAQEILAKVEKAKLDNVNTLIDIYKEATEDLKNEVKGLRLEIGELRKENTTLKSEIKKLEKSLGEFQHN